MVLPKFQPTLGGYIRLLHLRYELPSSPVSDVVTTQSSPQAVEVDLPSPAHLVPSILFHAVEDLVPSRHVSSKSQDWSIPSSTFAESVLFGDFTLALGESTELVISATSFSLGPKMRARLDGRNPDCVFLASHGDHDPPGLLFTVQFSAYLSTFIPNFSTKNLKFSDEHLVSQDEALLLFSFSKFPPAFRVGVRKENSNTLGVSPPISQK